MLKRSHEQTENVDDGSTLKKSIPENWRWLEDILDEAHLPSLGLPVRWQKTQAHHEQILVNARTGESIDLTKSPSVIRKYAATDFITSTAGTFPMPGADRPAAARVMRYEELSPHSSSSASNDIFVPCMAHGDYVCVTSLETDHLQAKSDIKRRQIALVDKLNSEPAFASYVIALPGIDKFFVYYNGSYYGTLFFYELYFNDIDNLWLICGTCNHGKRDEDVLSWFKDKWLYGQEFLDYLGKLDSEHILLKQAKTQQGLAQVAIQWYWERHAIYTCTAKRILENITTPLQILSRNVDRIIGFTRQSVRAERLQASLDAKLSLASAIISAQGLGLPRGPDESPRDSSDSDEYLQQMVGQIDGLTYQKAVEKTVPQVGKTIADLLKSQILEVQAEKLTTQAKKGDDQNIEFTQNELATSHIFDTAVSGNNSTQGPSGSSDLTAQRSTLNSSH